MRFERFSPNPLTRPPSGYTAEMRRPLSLRRITGMLCLAVATSLFFAFVLSGSKGIYWRDRTTVLDDILVFAVILLMSASGCCAGWLLAQERFSVGVLLVGVTVLTLAMGSALFLFLEFDPIP